VFVDVVDNLVGNIVTNAFATFSEQADLRRRYVILDELGDHPNIVLPLLKAEKRVICRMSDTLSLRVLLDSGYLPISVPLRSRMNAP
jgi:hypothetical protein